MQRSTVYREAGRFAGWPANYGLWAWGDEILACYVVGWLGPLRDVHARDMTRPFEPMQSRSLDGGATWTGESFSGRLPGARSLSADEHVNPGPRAAEGIRATDFVPLEREIDFDDPETIVMCARTGLQDAATSWFYTSRDRGRSWQGPHALPDFGLRGVAARTDIVSLGSTSALFLLTGTKADGTEGRVFAARTDDGGRSFTRVSFVGPEPAGWSIMPSSLRLPDGTVLATVRCAAASPPGVGDDNWIDLYASGDDGITWEHRARPVASTGYAGNPPALVDTRDGTLVLAYGYRDRPSGLRCVSSTDGGRTWTDPVVLTDDTPCHDMGYPKIVRLDDGDLLTVFYSNASDDGERFIESVRWSA